MVLWSRSHYCSVIAGLKACRHGPKWLGVHDRVVILRSTYSVLSFKTRLCEIYVSSGFIRYDTVVMVSIFSGGALLQLPSYFSVIFVFLCICVGLIFVVHLLISRTAHPPRVTKRLQLINIAPLTPSLDHHSLHFAVIRIHSLPFAFPVWPGHDCAARVNYRQGLAGALEDLKRSTTNYRVNPLALQKTLRDLAN